MLDMGQYLVPGLTKAARGERGSIDAPVSSEQRCGPQAPDGAPLCPPPPPGPGAASNLHLLQILPAR